jgi:hypothetical protein
MELSISREKFWCKAILVLFTLITTSFFLFPFEFYAIPGINTKMMMAVVGVVIVGWKCLVKRSIHTSQELLWVLALAGLFSLICLFSVTYNNTSDYAYASYITSMIVWLSAAYAATEIIQFTHQSLSFRLLTSYLLAVCTLQCLLALWIDNSPEIKNLVDAYINQGAVILNQIKRIYGIGAALDVAGTRCGAVLVITAAFLCTDKLITKEKWNLVITLISFGIVTVVGAMIARTTLVGAGIAIAYIVYATRIFSINHQKKNQQRLLMWILPTTILMTFLSIFLYQTNQNIHDLMRFAFEGFFNWYEKGTWETASTNVLEGMWVWPEHLKTWIIGDAFFDNPYYSDPRYTGAAMHGFYMGTDVGYLRFIFYCGLTGLAAFILFLLVICLINHKKYKNERPLFIALFILQLAIFAKVSTDIFLIYAFFFAANIHEEKNKPAEIHS